MDDKVYTTGQVARLCEVAARTVSKWTDKGLLPHWKIPPSGDRRIAGTALIEFLRKHQMLIPLRRVLDDMHRIVLLVGLSDLRQGLAEALGEGWQVESVNDAFDAGLALAGCRKPEVIVAGGQGDVHLPRLVPYAGKPGVLIAVGAGEMGCDLIESGWKVLPPNVTAEEVAKTVVTATRKQV